MSDICGANGRARDAGELKESLLYKRLECKIPEPPQPQPLPGRTERVPFFIVRDGAFPSKTWFMKPYPFRGVQRDLSPEDLEEERRKQRIFNCRHFRARRLSENAFGILTSRFGVFRSEIHFSPEKKQPPSHWLSWLSITFSCAKQIKCLLPISLLTVRVSRHMNSLLVTGEPQASPALWTLFRKQKSEPVLMIVGFRNWKNLSTVMARCTGQKTLVLATVGCHVFLLYVCMSVVKFFPIVWPFGFYQPFIPSKIQFML